MTDPISTVFCDLVVEDLRRADSALEDLEQAALQAVAAMLQVVERVGAKRDAPAWTDALLGGVGALSGLRDSLRLRLQEVERQREELLRGLLH